MKITIDTKEDSHEDIKKMVALLSEIIAYKENKDVFSNASPEMPNIFGMFDQQPTVKEVVVLSPSSSAAPSFGDTPAKKDLKDRPQVELY